MSLLDRLLTPSIIMPDGSYHKPLSPLQVKNLEEGKRLKKETDVGAPLLRHSKTGFKSDFSTIGKFCDECVQNGWMTWTLDFSASPTDPLGRGGVDLGVPFEKSSRPSNDVEFPSKSPINRWKTLFSPTHCARGGHFSGTDQYLCPRDVDR